MHSSRRNSVGPRSHFFAAALLLSAAALLSSHVAQGGALRPSATPAQDVVPPAPPPQSPADTSKPATSPASDNGSSSSKGKRPSHAHDFLIRGTVFQPSGKAFPGLKLRIRRESEKKFRWETFTNSRGEFAVRVPQGLQYELVVKAKGFAEQARQVDARSGITEDNMAFRLEPAAGGKKK
jgi:Carboxypeptidase regulatory-like domain